LAEMGFARQALHAGVLGFIHPLTQELVEFESALPHDIQDLISRLSDDYQGSE